MLERPSKLVSYRFDQLADQINKRVMPDEADVDRYVGLEHLDPDSLRIRRWGDTSEVESTKLLFKPGDIIFGKRRVYQRKVAVADFEGICSAHAMVLRAKPETVLPEFLPFFMQSDLFMERALSISVGSLSPTINWKALAKEEFLLPPIQEQARVCELMQSAKKSLDTLEDLHDAAVALLRADLARVLNHGPDPLRSTPDLPNDWQFTSLGKLIAIKHGFAFDGKHFSEEAIDSPILLTPGNFTTTGQLNFTQENTKHFTGQVRDGFWLKPNDLVVLMTDLTPSAPLLGAPGIVSDKHGEILQNQRIGLVQNIDKEAVLDAFLYFTFLGPQLRRMIRALSAGSTVSHTSPKDICYLRVPLPPIEQQRALVQRWEIMQAEERSISERLRQARSVRKQLVDDVFSGEVT